MDILGARQIRAARALLDWSQDDLAVAAQLSIATVRKLELGYISPRSSTTSVLRKAFEESGIEFLDSEGVRRRQEDIRILSGENSLERLIEDMSTTTKKTGGNILIVLTSNLYNTPTLASRIDSSLVGLIKTNSVLDIKVLMTDTTDLPLSTPRLEYRSLSTNYVDPMPVCVYGDKYALLGVYEGKQEKFIVIQSPLTALSSRRQFNSMWSKAMSPNRDFSISKRSKIRA